jgi:hypothetical protein
MSWSVSASACRERMPGREHLAEVPFDRARAEEQLGTDLGVAEAFSTPERIAHGIMEAVDADDPPLRLALGGAGANDTRSALGHRLRDLDAWAAVTARVDVPHAA